MAETGALADAKKLKSSDRLYRNFKQGSGLLMMVIEQLGNDPLWSASVDQSQNPLGLFSQLLGALEYPIERASEVVYPNL